MARAGFDEVRVSPRMVYVDSSRPDLVEGFTKNTFTAMIEGIRKTALESGIMSEVDFDKGVADLYRTTEAGGVFCYTFLRQVRLTIPVPNKTPRRWSAGSPPGIKSRSRARMSRASFQMEPRL